MTPTTRATTSTTTTSSSTSTTSSSAAATPSSTTARVGSSNSSSSGGAPKRHSPNDYIFGRLIGEGSFSSVFLAKEVNGSCKEWAIKVCEKTHILKEKKQDYIFSEKNILMKITNEWDEQRPFFVRLYSTFTDKDRLYFVMTYAKNGDLLKFIEAMAWNAIDCTQFYAAEIISAVEFLHSKSIIHRDLKPENILLNANMHILITDFGSAKLLAEKDGDGTGIDDDDESGNENENGSEGSNVNRKKKVKRKSFVGTPQYVSPEVLNSRGSSKASDLWAIGCILYQMVTGTPPFQSPSEFLIFQKIRNLDYVFHEGFNEDAKDLVQRLLVIDPGKRLGAKDKTPYTSIRNHKFFADVDFENLSRSTPPQIAKYVPEADKEDPIWKLHPEWKPGADRIQFLMVEEEDSPGIVPAVVSPSSPVVTGVEDELGSVALLPPLPIPEALVVLAGAERQTLLMSQKKYNKYHTFVEGHLILKQGILDKKKGLWARRRMFLLTEGPHLYYVDPVNMVLKGEIPWSPSLTPEIRDFRIFFVHTPNRIYHLTDPKYQAKEWCRAIDKVKQFYYSSADDESPSSSNSNLSVVVTQQKTTT